MFIFSCLLTKEKQRKKNKNYGRRMGSFIEILCAVFIPPVGVFLRFGFGVMFFSYIYHLIFNSNCLSKIQITFFLTCNIFFLQLEFWLSLLLTFFGFIPGAIYAIWVLTKQEPNIFILFLEFPSFQPMYYRFICINGGSLCFRPYVKYLIFCPENNKSLVFQLAYMLDFSVFEVRDSII